MKMSKTYLWCVNWVGSWGAGSIIFNLSLGEFSNIWFQTWQFYWGLILIFAEIFKKLLTVLNRCCVQTLIFKIEKNNNKKKLTKKLYFRADGLTGVLKINCWKSCRSILVHAKVAMRLKDSKLTRPRTLISP